MSLHVVIPYSPDKNLGRAYNRTIALYPDNSWICLLDHDVMFLTPDAIFHITEYTNRFPTAGLFTCYTNRLHPQSSGQLLGAISDNADIRHHIAIAEKQKEKLYQTTPVHHSIGGFMMVVNKEVWKRVKFTEHSHCLGVDNNFSDRILKAGKQILRMDGVYAFHQYRLMHGPSYKKHLR